MRNTKHVEAGAPYASDVATQLRLIALGMDVDTSAAQERSTGLGLIGHPRESGQKAPSSQKELGAYYTDKRIACFLLRWAIADGRETLLDPSFGGGVFLEAAAERITQLGGDASRQVFGVDVDEGAHRTVILKDGQAGFKGNLVRASFFDLTVDDLPPINAVVGNPPFIRYHRFKGEMRRAALHCALDAGVSISQLASSWAPFLVHAVQFVKQDGRLAMVVPAELLHATYAGPVLAYLGRSFRVIRVLSFSRRLFPDLSEDTVLLLAAGKGDHASSISLVNLPDALALADYENPELDLPSGIGIDELALGKTRERATQYMLTDPTRELYRRLQELSPVHTLAEIADVGIGYVSGDNDFFHVSRETVSAYGLPPTVLRKAVRRGRDLSGLYFGESDWLRLHDSGDANLLLYIPDGESLPDSVLAYLAEGVRAGVPNRYKCRVRRPWYRVPHVYEGHAFLSYMSGSAPKFSANKAGAVAPNTLLIVRFHALARRPHFDACGLAVAWQTSLTALSCEIEGHSLGGGMLKLEPSEAERVTIALPELNLHGYNNLAAEVDHLVRLGKPELARDRCDAAILRDGLGLSEIDVQRLREGWLALRARRLTR